MRMRVTESLAPAVLRSRSNTQCGWKIRSGKTLRIFFSFTQRYNLTHNSETAAEYVAASTRMTTGRAKGPAGRKGASVEV